MGALSSSLVFSPKLLINSGFSFFQSGFPIYNAHLPAKQVLAFNQQFRKLGLIAYSYWRVIAIKANGKEVSSTIAR